MSAADLQKPFTDGELRALLEQYPARPPTMGGSNVSHENSYLDHYVVSAWEKKCSAILKRREDAAPTLAARVLELEAENKRLRKEMQIVIDDCDADNPPSHGAIKHGLRAALKGGEI
jgi:hypothetical protein